MGLKRRRFLFLGGLTGLGLGGLAAAFSSHSHSAPDPIKSSIAQPLSIPVAPSTNGKPVLRFVATADTGAGDQNQNAVATAMSAYHQQHPYSLVVMAGDNIYTNGEISKIKAVFEQPYQALLERNVTFCACLGNHDIRTENGNAQLRYPGFHMQGRYYTYRLQSVQFFVLDTNVNADWNHQLPWLEKELSRSQATCKIVYGHHPIYSSGIYGTNAAFVKALTPLFQKYRVQLYINGHEHSYERTHPIAGTTYLITGNGGAALRPVGQSEWTAHSISRYGFTALEVFGDRIELSAIGTDNQVFDRGTIVLS
jgi:hypothetical protein